MEQIIIVIATGLYSGMIPIIPGLWGSALALFFWHYCKKVSLPVYVVITAGIFVLGLFASEHAEVLFAQNDASPIVIDEILGIFVTLTAVSRYRFGWLFGFLIFIILDGLKPFPVSWFDNNLNGGLGIMVDDLVSGIYALLLLHIILFFLSKKNLIDKQ